MGTDRMRWMTLGGTPLEDGLAFPSVLIFSATLIPDVTCPKRE
jgi:hypothetical protein